MPNGRCNLACARRPAVAGAPGRPVPATVSMIPVARSTTRIAVVVGVGDEEAAVGRDLDVAGIVELRRDRGPPSPAKPAVPLPATVSMVPRAKSTRRMRWFSVSAT